MSEFYEHDEESFDAVEVLTKRVDKLQSKLEHVDKWVERLFDAYEKATLLYYQDAKMLVDSVESLREEAKRICNIIASRSAERDDAELRAVLAVPCSKEQEEAKEANEPTPTRDTAGPASFRLLTSLICASETGIIRRSDAPMGRHHAL